MVCILTPKPSGHPEYHILKVATRPHLVPAMCKAA